MAGRTGEQELRGWGDSRGPDGEPRMAEARCPRKLVGVGPGELSQTWGLGAGGRGHARQGAGAGGGAHGQVGGTWGNSGRREGQGRRLRRAQVLRGARQPRKVGHGWALPTW